MQEKMARPQQKTEFLLNLIQDKTLGYCQVYSECDLLLLSI